MTMIRHTQKQWGFSEHIRLIGPVPVFIRKRRSLADRPF